MTGGTNARNNVVILGGAGNFGTRIARALAGSRRAELWIAGRNAARAEAVARKLASESGSDRIQACRIDRGDPAALRRSLRQLRPRIVIHTAGPFQALDYDVAQACIEVGSHYIDLADGRRFVAEFHQLDEPARQRGLLLVSGASTLPGLSSAVVNLLKNGMKTIDTIETSIVPSGQSARGRATITAVLSYCGKPVRVLEDGVWTRRIGWLDADRVRCADIEKRVAVCDVPDLELFPSYYAGVKTVTFHAGPEALYEHLLLRGMAWLAHRGLVRDWARHATSFDRLGRHARRFGSDVGFMQVRISGRAREGSRIERTWDLIAGSNHGPEIPCIPAIALARKLLENRIETRGAMPCLGLIGIEDFAREAQGFDIDWNLKRML